MSSHRTEVYHDGFHEFAWQCLTPGCHEEATGFETFEPAHEAANEHRRATATGTDR